MRYGVKTRPEHQTWDEIRELWLAADQTEVFDSAWNWDHFYPLTGDMTGPNFEGWTMLAALAEATSRIRIGCQVSGMIYRHPALLANMAATTDIISGGRLELGVGAGWNQMECDAYGIELPPLRERFDRFDEGVEAMVALLTQPVANFDGKYVKLTDARCEPKPVQQPHPPVVIGGRGKTRTLRTAARWAQQWHTLPKDADDWRDLKNVLTEHCAAIGRDPAEICCSVNVWVNSEDDIGAAAEQAAQWREAGVDLTIFLLPLHAKPGILDSLAQALPPPAPAG